MERYSLCARLTRKSFAASSSSSIRLWGCESRLLTRSILMAVAVGVTRKSVRAGVVRAVGCGTSCVGCDEAESCKAAAPRRDSNHCSQVGSCFSVSHAELG